MEHFITSNNVNTLVRETMCLINEVGTRYNSPKGEVVFLPRVTLQLKDPENRVLNLEGRKSNIFQLIAETFWVCSGSTRVTGFLEKFLPRASLYADDGVNWRGAYGGRLFSTLGLGRGMANESAFENVYRVLQEDILSRQGYVSIFDNNKDLPEMIQLQLINTNKSKDVPCNTSMCFWVDPSTMELNLDLFQRSGDIFWGTGSINLFEFSFMHELMFTWLKVDHPELKLGSYNHNVINLHYYPNNIGTQLNDIISAEPQISKLDHQAVSSSMMSVKGALPHMYLDFIRDCVQNWDGVVRNTVSTVTPVENYFVEAFFGDGYCYKEDYSVCHQDDEDYQVFDLATNKLFLYAKIVESAITGNDLQLPHRSLAADEDLFAAVSSSNYRKFNLEFV